MFSKKNKPLSFRQDKTGRDAIEIERAWRDNLGSSATHKSERNKCRVREAIYLGAFSPPVVVLLAERRKALDKRARKVEMEKQLESFSKSKGYFWFLAPLSSRSPRLKRELETRQRASVRSFPVLEDETIHEARRVLST